MRIVIASSWGPFFKFAFCWCFGRVGRNHQSAPIHSHPKPTVLVVGDLVVSVIMEGASVLARVKKLLTQPCKQRHLQRKLSRLWDTGSRRNVHRPNSALQTMLHRRHNLHFRWKAAAVFRIPMDQPTLRLSLHRGVWSGTGGFGTS